MVYSFRSPKPGFVPAALGALFAMTPIATALADTTWVSTATGVSGLVKDATLLGSAPSTQALHISVVLQLQNKSELDALVQSMSTPGSPMFGSKLTAAQTQASYSPTSAQAQAVVDYLTASGFSNINVAGNRMVIEADGTVAMANAAFNTSISQFVSNGKTRFANTTAAEVPSALGGLVISISGLQNISKPHVLHPKLHKLLGPVERFTPAATAATAQAITPPYLAVSYDVASVPTAAANPTAIYMEGIVTSVKNDLALAAQEGNLPLPPVTIKITDGTPTSSSGDDEFDLDSQSSLGAAGALSQEIWYDDAAGGLTDAMNEWVTDDIAQQISASVGQCEDEAEAVGTISALDAILEMAVAQGQTLFSSSGDTGSQCPTVPDTNGTPVGQPFVSYPASSPYDVAVGGTTLMTNADFTYGSETAWSDGGGGTSVFEKAPTWQTDLSTVTESAIGRGVPDIAFDANPSSGAVVIVAGSPETVGGTSLSAPMSNGFWTRIEAANNNAFAFAAPYLYAQDAKGAASSYPTAITGFHDITVGNNGLYSAGVGYDYTTGLGTFDVCVLTGLLGKAGANYCTAPATPIVNTDFPNTTNATTCTAPGMTLKVTPGASELMMASQTISLIQVSEPGAKPGFLVFTITTGSLSTLPPNTAWQVYFNTPAGVQYYMQMDTYDVEGTAEFFYGGLVSSGGSNTVTNIGSLDPSSNYTTAGVITLVAPETDFGSSMVPGGELTYLYGDVTLLAGAAGVGLIETLQSTTVSQYTLRSTALCGTATTTTGGTSGGTSTGGTSAGTTGGTTSGGTSGGTTGGTSSGGTSGGTTGGTTSAGTSGGTTGGTTSGGTSGGTTGGTTSAGTSGGTTGGTTSAGTSGGTTGGTTSAGTSGGTTGGTTSAGTSGGTTGGTTSAGTSGGTTGGTTSSGTSSGGTTGGSAGGTSSGGTTGGSAALNPPSAALSVTPSSGTAPLSVTFNASASSTPNSGATITSYTFNFGDGSAAVTQASATVSHTYTTMGSFTATLMVTDSDGETSNNTSQETVQVTSSSSAAENPPSAALSASPSSGTGPLAVSFSGAASTTPNSGATISSYTFSFGDGSASVTQSGSSISHTYASAGSYTATLSVTDSDGETSTNSSSQKINVTATASSTPSAALSASPASGSTPLTVSFNASASATPNSGASISSYTFNFGDGSATVTQSSATTSHVYSAVGGYTATVSVVDSTGKTSTNSAQQSISVTAAQTATEYPPEAAFSASPSSGTSPLAVSFNAGASSTPNSGASISSYTFNFGDGSASVTQSTATVSHTYSTVGSYTATLVVKDSDGETSTNSSQQTIKVSATATANDTPPDAALSAVSSSGTAPLTVMFNGSASMPTTSGASISRYDFSFGDGSADSVQTSSTVSHTYMTAGNYTASLAVTDSNGETSTNSAQQAIQVTAPTTAAAGAPNAALSASPSGGSSPLTVSFNGSASSTPNSGATISSYTFNFGDGSATVTQSSPTTSHVYATVGSYTATLVVKDSDGQTSSNATAVTITVGSTSMGSPNAALSASPDSGAPPLTVTLIGSASTTPNAGATIASYTFNFGDGTAAVTQSSPTLMHVYATAGSYVATLSVTDTDGESSTDTSDQTINVGAVASSGGGYTGKGGGAFGVDGLFGLLVAGFLRRRTRQRAS